MGCHEAWGAHALGHEVGAMGVEMRVPGCVCIMGSRDACVGDTDVCGMGCVDVHAVGNGDEHAVGHRIPMPWGMETDESECV